MLDLENDGASASEQQSDAPAATPTATPAGQGDAGALATPANLPLQTSGPAAQQQPTAQPQRTADPAAQATQAHHSILGRVAERLFSGGHTEYSIDPKTGTMVPSVVKEKPGDLFRHILAGAIMGGAAGSQQQDFTSGFFAGGAAGIKNSQEQDQQRRTDAQQQFNNQQGVRKLNEVDQRIANDATRHQAQQHLWTMSELAREHTADQRGLELLQKENALSLRKLEADEKAGGLFAPIKDNDKPANGAAMQKLFTEHPEEFTPPTGYALSVSKEYDLSGLKYDYKKNGWEDEQGNPATIADHTTWHVRYVPNRAANESRPYSGKELNSYFPDVYGGKLDPDKSYNLSLKDFTAVATKQANLHHQDWEENFRKTHEQVANVIRDGRNRLATLHSQYAAATRNFDDEKATEIQGQIDSLNDDINEKIQTAEPSMRAHAKDFLNTPLPAVANAPAAPGQTTPANPTPTAAAPGKPLVKPPKKGAPMTPDLVQKYIANNGGDRAKARSAALADGWTVPRAK